MPELRWDWKLCSHTLVRMFEVPVLGTKCSVAFSL